MDDEQKFDGLKAARDVGVSRVVVPRKQTNSVDNLAWLRVWVQVVAVAPSGEREEIFEALLAVVEATPGCLDYAGWNNPDSGVRDLRESYDALSVKIEELRNA